MTTSAPAVSAVITPSSRGAATPAAKRGAEPSGGETVPFEQALEQARAQLDGNQPHARVVDDSGATGSGDETEAAVVGTEASAGVVPALPLPVDAAMSSSVRPSEADVSPPADPDASGIALPAMAPGDRTGEAVTSGAAQTAAADLGAAPRVATGLNSQAAQGSATQPITPVPAEGSTSTPQKDGLRTSAIAQPASQQNQSGATEMVAPPAAAPVAPTASPTPAPAPVGPAAETRPAVQHPLLHEQIGPRLVAIRSLGDGTHRMTLRVEPEAIGPLRIVAEIRGDHVRVELMAVGEMGREALRSAMPELRRDLAAAGMQAQLDLATGGRSSDGDTGSSSGDQLGRGGRKADVRDGVHVQEAEPVSRLTGEVPAGRIDVLA